MDDERCRNFHHNHRNCGGSPLLVNRVWLFVVLLTFPLIGFGVAKGIQGRLNTELRSVLHAEFPDVEDRLIAEITVDRLCKEQFGEPRDLCSTNANLIIMGRAALGAGAVGLFLLLLIHLAGRLARNSRNLLALLFTPGLYATAIVVIGLILVYAAVGMAAIYYGESVLVGRVHVRIIIGIGIGALAGVGAVTRGIFMIVGKAETFVVGKTLRREQAPMLWMQIDTTAERLNALRPDYVVVGLDPGFFVTEADVVCLNGTLRGRTLYCSLPLCRILNNEELAAVIGHELGHFKGEDTKFSKRFYPIYRGTATSLEALQNVGGGVLASMALVPAVTIFRYFLESFAVAERRIGRERELAADRSASSVTSPERISVALVKLHAFTGVWFNLQEEIVNGLRQGQLLKNASKTYAETVADSASAEALEGISEVHLSHPTDSHPTLSVRLESLCVKIDDIITDVLSVAPKESAIDLVSGADDIEEEISEAYQQLIIRQLGIDIEEVGTEAEASA